VLADSKKIIMKAQINCLYWDNTNPKIVEYHQKVMNHFGIPVVYTNKNIHHGAWIDQVMSTTNADITVFIDSDCIPLTPDAIMESVKQCADGYLVGNAQVTNCIKAKHDLFCAPSFLVVSKDYYNQIGAPSAINNKRSDVAQEITRAAVEKEKRIKMYFPTSFQSVPAGGIWRLSGYGSYGIGTIFDEKMYHLFQARFQKNVDLFINTCECVLRNDLKAINRQYDCKGEYAGILPIEDDYGY